MTPRTPRSTRTDTLLPDTTRMRAGDIANEFAGIFHEFGSQVTIVNRSDKILRGYDEQIRDRSLQISMTKGIVFRFNAPFEKVVKNDDGSLHVHMKGCETVTCDALLFDTAHRPKSDDLGLENADAELDEKYQLRSAET